MENSTKALYIAASVLVAVLILSLVVYTFQRMGDTQTAREKVNEEKNISASNAEYEAFNKRLMYGADVISCINKAISNNETAKEKNDPDLYVDVQVKLTKPVIEEIQIYKIKNGKLKEIDTKDKDNSELNEELNKIKNKKMLENLFKCDKSKILTEFADNTTLYTLDIKNPNYNYVWSSSNPHGSGCVLKENDNSKEYYSLLYNGNPEAKELYKLVKTQEEYTYNFTTSDSNISYCIKWTTAFKSFRKMAFTCSKIEYNDNNGRVNKLVFEQKEKQ